MPFIDLNAFSNSQNSGNTPTPNPSAASGNNSVVPTTSTTPAPIPAATTNTPVWPNIAPATPSAAPVMPPASDLNITDNGIREVKGPEFDTPAVSNLDKLAQLPETKPEPVVDIFAAAQPLSHGEHEAATLDNTTPAAPVEPTAVSPIWQQSAPITPAVAVVNESVSISPSVEVTQPDLVEPAPAEVEQPTQTLDLQTGDVEVTTTVDPADDLQLGLETGALAEEITTPVIEATPAEIDNAQPINESKPEIIAVPELEVAPIVDTPVAATEVEAPLVTTEVKTPLAADIVSAAAVPVADLPTLQAADPIMEVTMPDSLPTLANVTSAPSLTLLPKMHTTLESESPAVSIPVETAMPQLTQVEQDDLQTKEYSLHDLLAQVVARKASDLHITANYRALARIDGKLVEIESQVLTHETIKAMLQEVVADHVKIDLDKDADIDLAYSITNPDARFRVNIFRQRGSLAAVFRVIPTNIRTIEELRLPSLISEFTTLSQGLVLVTGPTGSGKTTTLAAMLNNINLNQAKHIITIEDPIEYVYPKAQGLVDQRAVYIDTPEWTTGLRAALRQDPDVILIGEMRDTEAMEAALTMAETGHLVFSTLHTNGASQTINRIIDAFSQDKQNQVRNQLASTLMAVVSQRLIPISGGGRRVVVEIMVVTPAIRNAIRESKEYQIDNMIQTGAEMGMLSLEKSLAALVREGLITVESAQVYANKPEDVLTYLGRR
jgi:twitching motility protein PilT